MDDHRENRDTYQAIIVLELLHSNIIRNNFIQGAMN